ncbi:hypothetical protein TrLO_g6588 [Triparma laevis f. longispina]|uniref:Uncharacterized protein n=1 Tax=Triparma laevis f. longispina TaxID=1714387 RepID=A0A9W7FMK9_9STRA|nr:hypothetical protein TrLO_g6588 [Triparma laevis f. longispina]
MSLSSLTLSTLDDVPVDSNPSQPPVTVSTTPTAVHRSLIRKNRRNRCSLPSNLSSAPLPIGEINPDHQLRDMEQYEQERYGDYLEGATWNLFHMMSRRRNGSGCAERVKSPNEIDRLEASQYGSQNSHVPSGILHSDCTRSTSDSEDDDSLSIFSLEEIPTESYSAQLFEREDLPKTPEVDPMEEAMKRAMMVGRREYEGEYDERDEQLKSGHAF